MSQVSGTGGSGTSTGYESARLHPLDAPELAPLCRLAQHLFVASVAPTEPLADLGVFFHSNSPEVRDLLKTCISNEGVLRMNNLSSHVPIRLLTGLLFVAAGFSGLNLCFSIELRKQLRSGAGGDSRSGSL